MSWTSTEAIVLDSFDLHDHDRVVAFLTRERGQKRGVARGARRKYSRFAGQLQPLAKVRVSWFERENRDLVRISSVEVVRSAHRLQRDLEGILLGGYLADHVLEFAQENEESERLFRLLDTTLEALIGGADRGVAARYFEYWVLRLAGIFPAPRACPVCGQPYGPRGAVLPSGGEALACERCAGEGAGGLVVDPAALEVLGRISRESLASMASSPPEAGPLAVVEEVCGRLRRRFLQRELKSYTVMRRALTV